MHPYKRSKRVKDLIREEVTDIILHKLKDPRLGFITITDTEITEDLKLAKVYVSVLKKKDSEVVLKILNSARGFIKRELSSIVRLKHMPELEFFEDHSIDYANRIESLIKQTKGE
ncbi:MAG: 30S ribosome-binding factor RbfA [Candidatus Magnetoovum sp. WYHC-5]|nr:30S ribosome-binding factor RbfA [Candidatus Magnetoovum sp. WYHC-5]